MRDREEGRGRESVCVGGGGGVVYWIFAHGVNLSQTTLFMAVFCITEDTNNTDYGIMTRFKYQTRFRAMA